MDQPAGAARVPRHRHAARSGRCVADDGGRGRGRHGRVPRETGIRRTWIRFLQQVLADNPAIEVASDVPPFRFTQWDGKLLREIPRLRVKPGTRLDPATVKTRYADMAIESWRLFDRLQQEGAISGGVKFQISLPTPIAPTYNNMVPTDRPALIPALTTHMLGEVAAIAQALPNDRIALQWDVCQEVIAWEGYYEPGPVDFRQETIAELIAIGDGVPAARARLPPVLRQPSRRARDTAEGHRDHGRDSQCNLCWCAAIDRVLPPASA